MRPCRGRPPITLPTGRSRILATHPNPFSTQVTFGYALREKENVRVEIYDVTGRRVRAIHEGTQAAGVHELTWDGRDGGGGETPAGVYFLRLKTPTVCESRKVIMLR